MKTRSMCKAEQKSVDRISTLPQPILDTILCLLPETKEAARTCILSREWRYKWTTIPRLRFDLPKRTSKLTSDMASTKKHMDMHDVHQILLRHQGPIHDFSLHVNDFWEQYDYFELDQIMLHLSRNHAVKELTLDGLDVSEESMWYELPESVFTLHHLTDLYLSTYDIDHPSIFNGFSSLRSLSLIYVKISAQTLLHLLSNCPSLKKLSLHIDESGDTCELGDACTIDELLKCLPVIEDLTISGGVSEWLVPDSVPQVLPTSLIHLKSLCLNQFCLIGGCGSAFLLALIKCSPNLEKMHLEMEYDLEFSALQDEYSDVWLERLNKVSIWFCSSWLDIEFIKFILARSPKLEKVTIYTMVDRKQESNMLLTLKRAPRASPGVIIAPLRLCFK